MSFLKNITNSISSVFNIFKRPYHSSTLSFRGLLHSAAVAVAIFVFLFIFQPFGISVVSETEKTMTLAFCGGIALVSMLFCQFVLPLLLKSFYDEHHWTGSKQLVQFLIMSLAVSLALNFYLQKVTSIDFPVEGLKVFAYSIIPLVMLVFIQESIHNNKFIQKAENLNSDLKNKGVVTSENPLKVLVFRGASEKLSLIPNQLIYAKIDSNVSEFYYQNPLGIDKTVLNIDEKQVKDELAGHPQFVKVSANFILNTNAIQKVSGSARGYEIAIAKVNEEVKVSGKFRKNLENL
jgi:hypothetical protein